VVVAGYGIVFVVGRSILRSEYINHHQDVVSSLLAEFTPDSSLKSLHRHKNLSAVVIQGAEPLEPIVYTDASNRTWITSIVPIFSSQGDSYLKVREDITSVTQRHQRLLFLMLFTASASLLFVALMLRLVMWRGLILPFTLLTLELDDLEINSLGSHFIDSDSHPAEFQSIVESINQFQSRLSMSWKRERQFIDGAAHELRTPITVVSTTVQRLLSNETYSATAKDSLRLLLAESSRLGDLLNSMLDFARADAGRLSLSMGFIDPEVFLLDAFERLQGLSAERLQLQAPQQEEFPAVQFDPQRLHQCLAALVENALRYSPGIVHMALSKTNDRVIFHVRDCGQGIPVDERELVVKRFFRGTSSIGTRGSGIGLAIVNELADLMNASLVIENRCSGGADIQIQFICESALA